MFYSSGQTLSKCCEKRAFVKHCHVKCEEDVNTVIPQGKTGKEKEAVLFIPSSRGVWH